MDDRKRRKPDKAKELKDEFYFKKKKKRFSNRENQRIFSTFGKSLRGKNDKFVRVEINERINMYTRSNK